MAKSIRRVSQSPTNPHAAPQTHPFDVAELYQGPVDVAPAEGTADAKPLDEKLRQAYFWVVNYAIISPFYDIEYEEGPSATFKFGDRQSTVRLPSGQSYSASCCCRCSTLRCGASA